MTPEQDASSVSGLDLKPKIDFYTANSDTLYGRVAGLPDARDSVQLPQLEAEVDQYIDQDTVRKILSLFPDESLGRSILRKILFKNSLWFGKESTPTIPRVTNNPSEALSETAIIPSYTDYGSPSMEAGKLAADIHLYAIPSAGDSRIAKIITVQCLVHEIAHCVAAQVIWGDDYNLEFKDGTLMDGMSFIAKFCELTENLPSMSHYSGFYRNADGSYPGGATAQEVQKLLIAASEELAESITAYLLGFTYCEDDSERCLNPFKDRPMVRDLLAKFLEAE